MISIDQTGILLVNGRFHRNAHDLDPASALLVDGTRIAWIGDERDAPATGRRIDLGGACVLPGLTDAHVHIFTLALARTQFTFATYAPRSIADVLGALSHEAAGLNDEAWLQGCELNEDQLAEGRLPTRTELDAAFATRPVLLRRYCGHAAIFNSAAMHRLGLSETEPDPEHGHFERFADGHLNGIAFERAAEALFRAAPLPDPSRLRTAMRDAFAECLGFGLTAITEAAVGFSIGYDSEAAVWDALRRDGDMPLRIELMAQLTEAEAAQRGLNPFWSERWSCETLKFFADGIVGGRTSALSEPFCDRGGTGTLMMPEKVLRAELLRADAAGWRCAVHATGDRAIELVTQSFEQAARNGTGERRHRIEHCFCPPTGLFTRLRNCGVLTVMQPSFLWRMGPSIAAALGSRIETAYPGRSVLDAGAQLVLSSDAPTGILSPWRGVKSAVDRLSSNGVRLGIDEALDVRAALDGYIRGGALAMCHEGFRACLMPGMAADLAVLDRDPFRDGASDLDETRSILTMVDGRIVHSRLH